MRKGPKGKIALKPYNQHQATLFPQSLDELIPENHLVRTVSAAIDRLPLDMLLKHYKGGGSSSYDPRMLLKVLVYAYTERIYTSRRIAKAVRENIHFRWLSGNQSPDFRTINRFRSSRLSGILDQVFSNVLQMLVEAGYVKLVHYFLDGTKIEANANKHSYVWKKSTTRYRNLVEQQIRELLIQIKQSNDQENREYGSKDLPEMGGENQKISSEQLRTKMAELEKQIKELEESEKQEERKGKEKREGKTKGEGKAKSEKKKTLQRAKRKMEKDYLPRLEKYEQQDNLFNERNSFSKTDPDATFMRGKGIYPQGELKPFYNVQLATEGQYIIGWSIHQSAGDSTLFIPHLESIRQLLGDYMPKTIITDAGYGSEENYRYLEREGYTGYVKYNTYDQEQKRSFQKKRFRVENFPYDKASDTYRCPAGKRLRFSEERVEESSTGFKASRRVYKAEGCTTCRFRKECCGGKGNRTISRGTELARLRRKAKELLASDEGRRLSKQRSQDVEAVFGQMKQNGGFRRFVLRGVQKVSIEFGLLCLGHNLKKAAMQLT